MPKRGGGFPGIVVKVVFYAIFEIICTWGPLRSESQISRNQKIVQLEYRNFKNTQYKLLPDKNNPIKTILKYILSSIPSQK